MMMFVVVVVCLFVVTILQKLVGVLKFFSVFLGLIVIFPPATQVFSSSPLFLDSFFYSMLVWFFFLAKKQNKKPQCFHCSSFHVWTVDVLVQFSYIQLQLFVFSLIVTLLVG